MRRRLVIPAAAWPAVVLPHPGGDPDHARTIPDRLRFAATALTGRSGPLQGRPVLAGHGPTARSSVAPSPPAHPQLCRPATSASSLVPTQKTRWPVMSAKGITASHD